MEISREQRFIALRNLDSYSDAEHISIDISGIQKNLVLFMDKIGNNAHDNGDWADAKLIHVPDPNAADKVELKQTLDIAKALKEADYTVRILQSTAESTCGCTGCICRQKSNAGGGQCTGSSTAGSRTGTESSGCSRLSGSFKETSE